MFEHFHNVRSVFYSCQRDLIKYIAEEKIEALETDIAQRSANSQPIVMVYGVYNAGKSTLLNALIGREEAEVGDIPKTNKVSSYQIGDVSVLDTPGIDAPIEHETITREQLTKSDAVIFVLSSDGVLEEQQTYVEIRKILEAGKPLIVVINNKNGYENSSPEYVALIEKFRSNLQEFMVNNESLLEQLDQTPTFLVNAKLALKGKLEKKQKLVAYSQLYELEKAVQKLFESTNSKKVASTLAYQLSTVIHEALAFAELSSNKKELKKLETFISDVQLSSENISTSVKARAEKAKPLLKDNLYSLFQNDRASEVESLINDWQDELTKYFERKIETELQVLDAKASQVSNAFRRSKSFGVPFDEGHEDDNSGFSGLLKELFFKVGKEGKALVKDEVMKDGIVFILKKGKDFFPEIFKGIGKKTMEKAATKIVPFIGPAVDVAFALNDYFQARKEQQRQMNAAKEQTARLKNHVTSLVENIYDDFYELVDDILAETFKPIILSLESSLEELSEQVGSNETDIRALNDAIIQLKNCQ